MPLPPLVPCAIYVHDVHAAHGVQLPESYTPPQWIHHQYAAELWLQRALEAHAWRVSTPSRARVIFAAANFSMWCVARKLFSRRKLWGAAAADGVLWPSRNLSAAAAPAVLLTSQFRNCGPPWDPAFLTGAARPPRTLLLQDVVMGAEPEGLTVIAPFVVSRPPWLVAGRDSTRTHHFPPLPLKWAERKLIFMAGHVPKVYISTTRYLIWRQLRTQSDATVISSSLNCSVGAYAACGRGKEYWASRSHREITRFCWEACQEPTTCGLSMRRSKAETLSAFWRGCAQHTHINYTAEAADMARSTRRLPHAHYLELAMAHRFCLVAPGDYPSTHKITEAMALGGAGGCIPVFVLQIQSKHKLEHAVARSLPYTRWLDYCKVAYLVTEPAATYDIERVLVKLRAVSEAEAMEKLEELRSVRDAFVFRPNASTAPDFILSEICARAARMANPQTKRIEERPDSLAGGSHSRCLLA
ncbi:hypothetical protein AB1Y20_011611 [Prymnesium parvum]|uniref:Exostosin GT47 domain-containing protein n=1 Tax=Prymnesium parvum TaxID=97485 RepID=A0AB34IKA3_PRYPA